MAFDTKHPTRHTHTHTLTGQETRDDVVSAERERSHVLVERAVARQRRLCGAQLQVEVIHRQRDDDDQTQDQSQHQRQHLLQLLALVRHTLIRCGGERETQRHTHTHRLDQHISGFRFVLSYLMTTSVDSH